MIYRPKRWSLVRGEPSAEPVALATLKAHARIDDDNSDALIDDYIATARRKVEAYLNRSIMPQSWVLKISEFPSRETDLIELPGGTLQEVTSITYVDADGATQAWGAGNYVVDTGRAPGRVGLAYGATWPTIRAWDLPVTVTYSVGWASADAVPANVIAAIEHLAAWLYDNRGSEDAEMPRAVRMMASGHRIPPAILGRDG